MAISSAMEKSKSGGSGDRGKIPASCPVSGKKMMLDDKKSSKSSIVSEEDEDHDEDDFQGAATECCSTKEDKFVPI